MFGNELENLLETLFEDNNESETEDIMILNNSISPLSIFAACCIYSYAGYNG